MNAKNRQLECINTLSEEDWDTLRELTAVMIEVMASKSGALVLIADTKGNGSGLVHALGNQEIIPALMASAAMTASAIFDRQEGEILQ
jgi:hypothetical protein